MMAVGGEIDMTDHDAFLAALESNPGDDFAWLVYADWLEEQGEALCSTVRRTIEERSWGRWRFDLFVSVDRRKRRLMACDCVERVLPLFEGRYPDNPTPRRLVEALRRHATGKRVDDARVALAAACRGAALDASRDPETFEVAFQVAAVAYALAENHAEACLNAASAAVAGSFGPEPHRTPPSEFKPEWQEARDAELRWQVARLLRYRFGFLGAAPS
jgi:uncharacterized protein (TIGR02996 family)